MKIAIVGCGVSGLTAAYHLAARHDVTVFEKNAEPGGHANTVVVRDRGRELGVDTGFIVYNERTYRHFTRLLCELRVATQPSEMSFSARCRRCGVEYSGSSLAGLFARPSQLVRPSHYRMLADIVRFNREGTAALDDPALDGETIAGFLRRGRYSSAFVRHYVLPMGGAIWSSDAATFERFPVHYFLRFFHNHGLLSIRDRPEWRTISGGSRTYVRALVAHFADRLRLSTPVSSIRRGPRGVTLSLGGGTELGFDRVVIATHSDQALRLLADPSDTERQALGAIRYQPNEAVFHTDASLLPKRRHTVAAWNVQMEDCVLAGEPLSMTYSLNHLQRIDSPTHYCVTLNDRGAIAPEKVIRRIAYAHPVYTHDTLAAQRTLERTNGERGTLYCGAYLGYGFHEDGVRTALDVVRAVDEERGAA